MAFVETRVVRTFRFEMPDDAAAQLMRTYTDDEPIPGTDPACDAAWQMARDAFDRWNSSEDAKTPFCFDETADCVLGDDILHGFEIVPESALNDGTTIV